MRGLLVNLLVTLLVYSIASHGSIVRAMVFSATRTSDLKTWGNARLGPAERQRASSTSTPSSEIAENQNVGSQSPSGSQSSMEPNKASEHEHHGSKELKSIESAMKSGDWALALEIAQSRRKKNADSLAWMTEAEILMKMGKYGEARAALLRAQDLLPTVKNESGEKPTGVQKPLPPSKLAERIQQNLVKVEEWSRGRDPREPPSKHRSSLSSPRNAVALQEKRPKERSGVAGIADSSSSKKIVKTWYFWATIGAIAAAAIGIAVISIKADSVEHSDALGFAQRKSNHRPILSF